MGIWFDLEDILSEIVEFPAYCVETFVDTFFPSDSSASSAAPENLAELREQSRRELLQEISASTRNTLAELVATTLEEFQQCEGEHQLKTGLFLSELDAETLAQQLIERYGIDSYEQLASFQQVLENSPDELWGAIAGDFINKLDDLVDETQTELDKLENLCDAWQDY